MKVWRRLTTWSDIGARFRCSKCFIAVWSAYRRRPNFRLVHARTFDEPSQFSPAGYIFVRSKLGWVIIPKVQPSFDTYYTINKEWSLKELADREVALNGS